MILGVGVIVASAVVIVTHLLTRACRTSPVRITTRTGSIHSGE